MRISFQKFSIRKGTKFTSKKSLIQSLIISIFTTLSNHVNSYVLNLSELVNFLNISLFHHCTLFLKNCLCACFSMSVCSVYGCHLQCYFVFVFEVGKQRSDSCKITGLVLLIRSIIVVYTIRQERFIDL